MRKMTHYVVDSVGTDAEPLENPPGKPQEECKHPSEATPPTSQLSSLCDGSQIQGGPRLQSLFYCRAFQEGNNNHTPRRTYWHCPNLKEGRRVETLLVEYFTHKEDKVTYGTLFHSLPLHSPSSHLPQCLGSHLPDSFQVPWA